MVGTKRGHIRIKKKVLYYKIRRGRPKYTHNNRRGMSNGGAYEFRLESLGFRRVVRRENAIRHSNKKRRLLGQTKRKNTTSDAKLIESRT